MDDVSEQMGTFADNLVELGERFGAATEVVRDVNDRIDDAITQEVDKMLASGLSPFEVVLNLSNLHLERTDIDGNQDAR